MPPSPVSAARAPRRRRLVAAPWLLGLLLLPGGCGRDEPSAAARPADAAPPPRAAAAPARTQPEGEPADPIAGAPVAPPPASDPARLPTADLVLGLPVALENHISGLRRVIAEMSAAPSPPELLPRLDALVLRLEELKRRADQGEPLEQLVPPDVRDVLQADMADFPKAWLAPDERGLLPGESLPLPARRPQ